MDWIAALGGDVQPVEEQSEAGIIYLSRFYRLRDGRELPVLTERGAGGDLGYMGFAGFYGDNGTFSITFGVPTVDRELMALRDVDAWEAAVRTLTPLEPWTEDGLADPITDVEAMARLTNRIRRFVVDGEPVATGLVVIGDAAVTTNPWYGKGCAQAGIAAEALSAALREHGRDGVGVALAMDEAMRTELEPHYVASCTPGRRPDQAAHRRCTTARIPIPPRRRRGTSSSTASSPPRGSTPTCSGPSSARSTCSTTPTRCWPTRRCSPRPAPRTRRRTNAHHSPISARHGTSCSP